MTYFRLFVLVFCAAGAAAFGAEDRAITRVYGVSSPPKIDSARKAEPGETKIVRIYRKADQNVSEPAAETKIFIGSSIEVFNRKRDVKIDSLKNGARIKMGSKEETADGSIYKFSESETKTAPGIEIGLSRGRSVFFGAKAALQEDFKELRAFAGVRADNPAIAGFTPIARFSASIGYEKFAGSIKPDNFSAGLDAGLERFIVEDSFSVSASAFYRYRVWRNMDKIYGRERWNDGEFGAEIGARFYF